MAEGWRKGDLEQRVEVEEIKEEEVVGRRRRNGRIHNRTWFFK